MTSFMSGLLVNGKFILSVYQDACAVLENFIAINNAIMPFFLRRIYYKNNESAR